MPGGGIGAGLDFDLPAVIQAALVGFVLLAAAAAALRRAASRYFLVDAAGFGVAFLISGGLLAVAGVVFLLTPKTSFPTSA